MVKTLSTSNLYEPNKEKLLSVLQRFDGDLNGIVGSLEEALKNYHETDFCVLFSTGFWALVAAARIKQKQEGSEVIMPSFTYRRLADVAFWAGLTPVFVDVDPVSLAISPKAVRNAVSSETALILAVHPIVGCCDIEKIMEISETSNVPVIFDAVESVHETHGGKRIGSFGPGEVFSLHTSKLLNGMEGGYVCTNDREFSDKLGLYKDGALEGSLPLRIDPVHALFALQSLEEIDQNVRHNKIIFDAYDAQLADFPQLKLLRFEEAEQCAYKNIVAEVVDDARFTRDALVVYLNKNGIMARSHYSPPLHDKNHSFATREKGLVVTNEMKSKFINLPCGQRVSEQDVADICDMIRGFSHEQ